VPVACFVSERVITFGGGVGSGVRPAGPPSCSPAADPLTAIDIQGAGPRRRWSDEAKGRILAESYAPGAVVLEVARQHDISPQHLFAWRKAARAGLLSLPADEAPMFVPVVTKLRHDGMMAAASAQGATAITIEIGGAVFVRHPVSTPPGCGTCCGP
jgi:transposase